jgi:hypothetical protein
MITNDNIDSIKEYVVESRSIRQAIIEQFEAWSQLTNPGSRKLRSVSLTQGANLERGESGNEREAWSFELSGAP